MQLTTLALLILIPLLIWRVYLRLKQFFVRQESLMWKHWTGAVLFSLLVAFIVGAALRWQLTPFLHSWGIHRSAPRTAHIDSPPCVPMMRWLSSFPSYGFVLSVAPSRACTRWLLAVLCSRPKPRLLTSAVVSFAPRWTRLARSSRTSRGQAWAARAAKASPVCSGFQKEKGG